LALGQVELETNSSGALAYALASLEHADTEAARLFALEALWRGPTGFVLPTEGFAKTIDFSPDGEWLAVGRVDGLLELWPRDGGAPTTLGEEEPSRGDPIRVRFAAGSDRLVVGRSSTRTIEVWSVPEGELVRIIRSENPLDFRLAEEAGRFFTLTYLGERAEIRSIPIGEGEPEFLGHIPGEPFSLVAKHPWSWVMSVDRSGTQLARVDAPMSGVLVRALESDGGDARVPSMGSHPERITRTGFHPDGIHLGTADFGGEVQIWDLTESLVRPSRTLTRRPAYLARSLRFDRSGSRLVVAGWGGRASLWDIGGPPEEQPQFIHRGEANFMLDATFEPESRWLATSSDDLGVTLYPIERRYPLKLEGHPGDIRGIAFLPDGTAVATAGSRGTLRLWPLSAAAGERGRTLLDTDDFLVFVAAGPGSRNLLALESTGKVWLVPVDGSTPRTLIDLGAPSGGHGMPRLALGARTAAVVKGVGRGRDIVYLIDIESGGKTTVEPEGWVVSMAFTPEEDLILSTDPNGIQILRRNEGTIEALSDKGAVVDLSPDGRFLMASSQGGNREAALYDLEGGTSRPLSSHGSTLWAALDPQARIAVTAGLDPYLRVSSMSGGEPHLLPTSSTPSRPIVSPDGQWIAARDKTHTLTLWPVPDLSQQPLHTLPLDELLAKLRSLTNLRVEPDPDSQNGWALSAGPFPGWEALPTW
jgi:WD40 repeat protein